MNKQFPPFMMVRLLIYDYATGTFSSRRIETPTYENVAMKRLSHGRRLQQLEKHPDPPAPPFGASIAEIIAQGLETKTGNGLYGLRKQTVEPLFDIIKEALGFRRLLLRGMEKGNLEWTPVNTSYNLKRPFNLGKKIKTG